MAVLAFFSFLSCTIELVRKLRDLCRVIVPSSFLLKSVCVPVRYSVCQNNDCGYGFLKFDKKLKLLSDVKTVFLCRELRRRPLPTFFSFTGAESEYTV